jgi:hypothetical protein
MRFGVDHKTVASQRAELESIGEIPQWFDCVGSGAGAGWSCSTEGGVRCSVTGPIIPEMRLGPIHAPFVRCLSRFRALFLTGNVAYLFGQTFDASKLPD